MYIFMYMVQFQDSYIRTYRSIWYTNIRPERDTWEKYSIHISAYGRGILIKRKLWIDYFPVSSVKFVYAYQRAMINGYQFLADIFIFCVNSLVQITNVVACSEYSQNGFTEWFAHIYTNDEYNIENVYNNVIIHLCI